MAGAVLYLAALHKPPRANPLWRPRPDYYNILTEDQFVQRYRFPQENVRTFAREYQAAGYGNTTERSHALSAEMEWLVALRFFATGSMFMDIGDIHGVSKSSVSKAVHRVMDYLNEIAPDVIRFPSTDLEMAQNAKQFHGMYGMPRVIGCVDGTFVNMIAPVEEEEAFVNRKWNHALNVQVCCGPNLKFISVDARWPGSQNDAFVWNNSELKTMIQRRSPYILLGDSGYPNRPFLLTPYLSALPGAQNRYNTAHKKTRCIIERCIGVLKQRFRCLDATGGISQMAPGSTSQLTIACCVLHNLARDLKIPDPEPLQFVRPVHPGTQRGTSCQAGHVVRNALVQSYFSGEN